MKEAIFGTFTSSLFRLLESGITAKTPAVGVILTALHYTLRHIPHNKIRSQQPRLVRALVAVADADKEKRSAALECLALIPESNASWNQILEPTIEAIHYILHHVYEGFESDRLFDAFGQVDETEPSVIADTLQIFAASTRHRRVVLPVVLERLDWLVTVIQLLLGHGPAAIVSVPVEALMDLIEHFLLLDGSVLKSREVVKGLEVAEVVAAIPPLHSFGYRLLESLAGAYVSLQRLICSCLSD